MSDMQRKPWHDVPVRNPVYIAGTRVKFGDADTDIEEPILIGYCGALRITTEDGHKFTVGRDTRRRWRKRESRTTR